MDYKNDGRNNSTMKKRDKRKLKIIRQYMKE